MKTLPYTSYIKPAAIGLAVVVVVIIIVYFVGKKQGKQLSSSGNKGLLPSQTDYGQSLTQLETKEIIRHADALYKDMNGLNLLPRDASVYTEYLASSDRVFVGTANYFYDNYGRGDNLAQWIDSEAYWFTNSNLKETINSIQGRLAKFGILP